MVKPPKNQNFRQMILAIVGLVVCVVILPWSCTSANHIGNPLTLPIRGISAAFENASYDRRRGKVKAWIIENEATLRQENFDGAATTALLQRVPPHEYNRAKTELREAATHPDFTERATVIVMVLSD